MPDLISDIFSLLKRRGGMLATAESCTGGMIAAAITDVAGSSEFFDRGFITYANQSKIDMLDVLPETLERHGAVSEQTASEMALGALNASRATCAVSVTGIAGPGGGTADKPVGLVYMGVAVRGEPVQTFRHIFTGDRAAIRAQAVQAALKHVKGVLS
jgi:nicotinamide-nucleotide amidase